MVESQRDLLLKAVHELRQKYTVSQQTASHWDVSCDIDRVLRQLGVPFNDSEGVENSMVEELSSLQSSSEVPGPHFPNLEARSPVPVPRPSHRSSEVPAPIRLTTPDFNSTQALGDDDLLEPAASQGAIVISATFDDEPHSGDDIIRTEWPASIHNVYFSYPTDPADLDYLNMDSLLLQTWQNETVQRDTMRPAY